MLVELHCHSTCSDGSLPPQEVARWAGERGARLFALTDHDTFTGCEDARAALPEGVAFLRSLELSCKYAGRTVHLLLYGAKGDTSELTKRLDRIRTNRQERIRAICEKLEEHGISIDPEPILTRSGHGSPGRPHVAKALVDAGAVTSVQEAFDRFLKDGGSADVPVERISLEDGVALGQACGARMSMAHPHMFKEHALVRAAFDELRDAGLTGIEALYGPYGPHEQRPWLQLAEEKGLVPTGGSDYHGYANPKVARPVIDLPDVHARRLLDWLDLPQSLADAAPEA